MLNKDQYNQDEYNDYYQQEIRGAETNSSSEEKPSGKGGILIFLGLIILAVAGYFGYKTMNTSTADSSATDETIVVQKEVEEPKKTIQSVEKKPTEEEVKKEEPAKVEEGVKPVEPLEKEVTSQPIETVKEETETRNINDNNEIAQVADNVQKAMGEEQKMSPEEIAKVVQMVMSQMNSKQEETTKESSKKEEEPTLAEDSELMSALSGTDTDSVNDENQKLEDALNNISETTKDTSIKNDDKAIDTYNKIKVSGNTGDDELSKLSSQISNLISDKSTSDQTNNSKEEKTYTESLKQEVVTRKNEMRIIVVRKGDTLGRIAKRAYGNVMEYKKIYQANPDMLKRPDRIYIGQKLRIPK
jgi:nucleoid-associated protein YgaU